jgi:hypothetical protein
VEIMRRIILACALAGILGVPAKADETLKFRIVGHATSFQSQDVGDVDGHAFLLARLSGLASFPDGSVAPVSWAFQGDYIKGAGPALAYVSVTFSDGSVLRYKTTVLQNTDGTSAGPVSVLGGKGRFEGAKGDGTVTGVRVGPPGPDANAYFDLVINVKK